MFKSAKSGFRTGAAASLLLVLLLVGVAVFIGADAYEGHCISFEPPQQPCSLVEYLLPYLLFLIVYSTLGRPDLALAFLLVLLVLPLGGFFLGRRNQLRRRTELS